MMNYISHLEYKCNIFSFIFSGGAQFLIWEFNVFNLRGAFNKMPEFFCTGI